MIACVAPVASAPADPTDDADYPTVLAAFTKAIGSARPMENNCGASPTNPAMSALLAPYRARQAAIPSGAARFPIRYCRYTLDGLRGDVVMMNPDPEQLARWVVSACRNATRVGKDLDHDRCLVATARRIWLQSNGQYPVTGTVVEPAGLCNKAWRGQARFGFRHGVTVGLKGLPPSPNEPIGDPCKVGSEEAAPSCTIAPMTDAQLATVLTSPVTKTADNGFARLSSLARRDAATRAPGRCTPLAGEQPSWLDVARDGYLQALGQDRYPMLERWLAVQTKAAFDEVELSCAKLGADMLTSCKSHRR